MNPPRKETKANAPTAFVLGFLLTPLAILRLILARGSVNQSATLPEFLPDSFRICAAVSLTDRRDRPDATAPGKLSRWASSW
jgi:hypothetical protein